MIVPGSSLSASAPGIGAVAPSVAVPIPPAVVSPLDDGGVEVDLAGPAAASQPAALRAMGWDANLAEALSDDVLADVAEEVIEGFEADWESNSLHREVIENGLKLLGLKPGERISKPFHGATGVCGTLLTEAAVRFQASAAGELLPASGPARMQVVGDSDPDTEARARRKQDWMNYYLTVVDRGWVADKRQQILLTGLYGTTYSKVYRDPRRGLPRSRALTCFDLVMSATSSSLDDADRLTQVERTVTAAEMRRLQLAGYYRDVVLSEPEDGIEDEARGAAPMSAERSERMEDAAYEILHQYVLLDLEGLEHATEGGEETGLPLPYIVSVERHTRTVLRLVRNYAESDDKFLPLTHFTEWKYHPGLDVNGWGLIHLVGQSADAETTLLRQAINAFTLASFPGGFRVKGLKAEHSIPAIGPCEFVELETGGMPIQSAIMSLPYKDVPGSFGPLFAAVQQNGQRLGNTVDMAVGDGREDSPVGTTMALIEKATKIESSVVKSLHGAMGLELQMLADLFGQADGETYPYVSQGKRGQAVAADFQDNGDIVPVADPNAPTQTQRLTQAQGVYALAQASGPLMDKRAALENMLRTMGKSDSEIAILMPPPVAAVSADPVTEIQAMLAGSPVQARPDQDHAAHLAVHGTQMAMPGIDKTPVAAMLAAHMADHIGQLYRAKMSAAIGHPLPPAGPVPPAVEAQITAAVMAQAQSVAASMPPAAGQGAATKPDMGPVEAKIKMAEIAAKQADSDRKALIAAKQDEIKIASLNVTSQDEEANRQQAQRNNATKLATGLLSMHAQGQQAQQQATLSAMEGTHSIMAEGQRQAGQAMQNRHDAGMSLLQTLTQLARQSHEAGMTTADMAEAAKQRHHQTRMKQS